MKIVEKWLFLVLLVLPISGLYAEQSSSTVSSMISLSQRYMTGCIKVWRKHGFLLFLSPILEKILHVFQKNGEMTTTVMILQKSVVWFSVMPGMPIR